MCVADVESCLIDLGLGLFDVSHGGVSPRFLGPDLIGASLDGLCSLEAGLRQLLEGLGDLGLIGDDVGFGLEDGCLIGSVCGYGGVELLL